MAPRVLKTAALVAAAGLAKDEAKAVEYVTVSDQTQKVDGVPCRVVLDRLYLDGRLAETTRDYYSQDSRGNVWYFGEDTAELEADGTMVGTEGTWHAAEAGAQPGIFMPPTRRSASPTGRSSTPATPRTASRS